MGQTTLAHSRRSSSNIPEEATIHADGSVGFWKDGVLDFGWMLKVYDRIVRAQNREVVELPRHPTAEFRCSDTKDTMKIQSQRTRTFEKG